MALRQKITLKLITETKAVQTSAMSRLFKLFYAARAFKAKNRHVNGTRSNLAISDGEE